MTTKDASPRTTCRRGWRRQAIEVFCTAALLLAAQHATALPLTVDVPGTSNLYFGDWGHPYDKSDAEVAAIASSQGIDLDWAKNIYQAVGDGSAPVVVPFAFLPAMTIWFRADGCVIDAGPACTDADGEPWLFRDLPVYSLIGLWSLVDDAVNPDPLGTPFFLGSAGQLTVPTPTGSSALYLLLAENDGIFADNHAPQGNVPAYRVHFGSVPAPPTLALIALGLLGLVRRRGARPAPG